MIDSQVWEVYRDADSDAFVLHEFTPGDKCPLHRIVAVFRNEDEALLCRDAPNMLYTLRKCTGLLENGADYHDIISVIDRVLNPDPEHPF